ncbi:unnamed protein product [Mycena citricolor]|uniref:Uncharacterized protein n=1 Tax=Mycena citricolor TaxID=2018698 RepID=A0AAD2K2X4_9AGAR|nr:unnamed protein product [Mycena citricolor]
MPRSDHTRKAYTDEEMAYIARIVADLPAKADLTHVDTFGALGLGGAHSKHLWSRGHKPQGWTYAAQKAEVLHKAIGILKKRAEWNVAGVSFTVEEARRTIQRSIDDLAEASGHPKRDIAQILKKTGDVGAAQSLLLKEAAAAVKPCAKRKMNAWDQSEDSEENEGDALNTESESEFEEPPKKRRCRRKSTMMVDYSESPPASPVKKPQRPPQSVVRVKRGEQIVITTSPSPSPPKKARKIYPRSASVKPKSTRY